MIKTRYFRFGMPLLMALLAVFATSDTAHAQAMEQHSMDEAMGVAVLNESPREVRVYAFHGTGEERVLLGWVGGEELEYFAVPEHARGPDGAYQLAVQAVTPLPQIGVEASPHPMKTTLMLEPGPMETVRLVVDDQMELTHRIVR